MFSAATVFMVSPSSIPALPVIPALWLGNHNTNVALTTQSQHRIPNGKDPVSCQIDLANPPITDMEILTTDPTFDHFYANQRNRKSVNLIVLL